MRFLIWGVVVLVGMIIAEVVCIMTGISPMKNTEHYVGKFVTALFVMALARYTMPERRN